MDDDASVESDHLMKENPMKGSSLPVNVRRLFFTDDGGGISQESSTSSKFSKLDKSLGPLRAGTTGGTPNQGV